MNEFRRMIGVFVDPGKTFADIVGRPTWWVPIIVVAVLSLVFTYCYSQHVGFERVIRQTLESNERVRALPPEQRERVMEAANRFTGVSAYGGGALAPPVTTLVVAAVLLFIFNTMGGGQITYKQALGVTAYSYLTSAVSIPLGILVMYLKSPEDFDIRNPLAFNLGAFLSSDTPKGLLALASSIDLFSFWTLALLATGFAIARKIPWSRALIGVAVPWIVFVALKVARAGLFG